jgi:hypothetical protein
LKPIIFIISCLIALPSVSQIGGNSTFQFLNFTGSARVASTGGYLLTIRDNDATLGQENPALLNREMHGMVNFNYVNYFADANYGFTSYTKHIANVGTFNGSLLFANYGQFDYADVNGDRNGSQFQANDLALSLGYGRPLDSLWSVGASVRLIGSFYEKYNAFGIASDLGVNYYKKSNGFGFALLAKNIGVQLNGYSDNNRESLPFNLITSVSKKLEHAPFRFSLTYDNMQKWNVLYFNDSITSTTDQLTGELIEIKPPSILKKAAHHITIGGEMLLSKTFHLRFGYNHFNRSLMKVNNKPGLTGFSLGIGFKMKNFLFSYGLSKTHIAGTENHLTLSKRFGKMPAEDSFYRQFD